jgi:alpha-beta hydrolase superfamily lysophospholipase
VTRPDQLVDDIAAFIAHVRQADEVDSVVLGGHSAGGGLVLGAARSRPEAADAYLFLAPYLGLGGPASRPHFGGWVRLRILPLLAVAAANLLGVARFNDTTVLDFDPDACARDGRYVPSWSFNTLLAFGPGRWMRHAAPIPEDRPVLVLAGAGDECFDYRSYRDAFDVVAPHAENPDVGPCGHWDLLVDLKAISLIGAWLARRPGSHRTNSAQRGHRRAPPPRKKRA